MIDIVDIEAPFDMYNLDALADATALFCLALHCPPLHKTIVGTPDRGLDGEMPSNRTSHLKQNIQAPLIA